MATIIVRTGVAFRPIAMIVTTDGGEFTPDEVFIACNRCDTCQIDCMSLPHEWQKALRHLLDAFSAASMSVGDSYDVVSDKGIMVGRWTCDSIGWSVNLSGVARPAARELHVDWETSR